MKPDTSIAQLQDGYRDGSLRCVDVIRWHLDRIEAMDQQGPSLNCVMALLPNNFSLAWLGLSQNGLSQNGYGIDI